MNENKQSVAIGQAVNEHDSTSRAKRVILVNSTGSISSDTLASYRISDKDDDASPNYYGFVNADGAWYILKETVSAGADTYRYAAGSSDYTTNWTNRASLSYGYFYSTF